MASELPLLVRAHFVLGGKAVVVADNAAELYEAVTACLEASPVARLSVERVFSGSEAEVRSALAEQFTDQEIGRLREALAESEKARQQAEQTSAIWRQQRDWHADALEAETARRLRVEQERDALKAELAIQPSPSPRSGS